MFTHVCIHIGIYTCLPKCIHIFTYIHKYTHAHTYMNTHMMHIHTCIHTEVHTWYTHAYTHAWLLPGSSVCSVAHFVETQSSRDVSSSESSLTKICNRVSSTSFLPKVQQATKPSKLFKEEHSSPDHFFSISTCPHPPSLQLCQWRLHHTPK